MAMDICAEDDRLMIAVGQQPRLTPQMYWDWEVLLLRYEHFDGQVFTMAGGTLPHTDILR